MKISLFLLLFAMFLSPIICSVVTNVLMSLINKTSVNQEKAQHKTQESCCGKFCSPIKRLRQKIISNVLNARIREGTNWTRKIQKNIRKEIYNIKSTKHKLQSKKIKSRKTVKKVDSRIINFIGVLNYITKYNELFLLIFEDFEKSYNIFEYHKTLTFFSKLNNSHKEIIVEEFNIFGKPELAIDLRFLPLDPTTSKPSGTPGEEEYVINFENDDSNNNFQHSVAVTTLSSTIMPSKEEYVIHFGNEEPINTNSQGMSPTRNVFEKGDKTFVNITSNNEFLLNNSKVSEDSITFNNDYNVEDGINFTSENKYSTTVSAIDDFRFNDESSFIMSNMSDHTKTQNKSVTATKDFIVFGNEESDLRDTIDISKVKEIIKELLPSNISLETPSNSNKDLEKKSDTQPEYDAFIFPDDDRSNSVSNIVKHTNTTKLQGNQLCPAPLIEKEGTCVPNRENFKGGCPTATMRADDGSCQPTE